MRWEGTSWINLSLEDTPEHAYLSAESLGKKVEENEKLTVECEVLLHLLTRSEQKKAKSERILSNKKHTILSLMERLRQQRGDE